MFVDKVKVHAKAGDGGNGCVAFRREQFIDRGGPDGGDGGNGGDVVLIADKNASDLSDYFFSPRLLAPNGGHGKGKNCTGKTGKAKTFKVPVGTQVFRLGQPLRELSYQRYRPGAVSDEVDYKSDKMLGIPHRPGRARQALAAARAAEESALPAAVNTATPTEPPVEPTRELIADLVEEGQRFILAKGGGGGRGNRAFKSSTHQAPREFEYGEPGEELHAELELKTLADVGLVGYPNAGKSTLLSKLTRAHPKIAAYPFTTLTPNVGLTDYDDYSRITIADIPGLIEGAHSGRGLGHDFLRHIERCRLLLILIDMAGVDARKPWADYQQLLEELELYNKELLHKPRVVVANKSDLPAAKKNLATFKRKHKVRVIPISAQDGIGLEKLKLALRKQLP
ncbi:MAG: GTPase Obg [Verrucomicrobiae bacterium]|nr:GTPase Obg [Verrucomicrobiae bacterium]